MKETVQVVKQLYRLSVEPRVVEKLAKLSDRLGEPKSRLATRLFTAAVLSAPLRAARPVASRPSKKARP